jgi:hypothetical protein
MMASGERVAEPVWKRHCRRRRAAELESPGASWRQVSRPGRRSVFERWPPAGVWRLRGSLSSTRVGLMGVGAVLRAVCVDEARHRMYQE